MNFYNKKGNKNYKENRLIKKIKEVIDKNPALEKEIKPASNLEELQALHDKYVVEDADFKEIEPDTSTVNEATKKNTETTQTVDDMEDDNSTFSDPFNREEPIVRTYVTDEDYSSTKQDNTSTGKTTFDEPTSHDEAFSFELPNENTPSGNPNEPKREKKDNKKTEPVNPSYDDMSEADKRRNTKKFAHYISEIVFMAAEKGFVLFANRDINPAKLAEYELNGEMDLSLALTLSENQTTTVKQFLEGQCIKAEELAKFDPEEKRDFANALAKVMMEKGIGPTPMQELLLIGGKMLVEKGIMLYALRLETSAVLTQLRQIKAGTPTTQQQYFEEPAPQQEEKVYEPTQQQEEIKKPTVEKSHSLSVIEKYENEIGIQTETEQEIETKE
jgi:hypothetical protein